MKALFMVGALAIAGASFAQTFTSTGGPYAIPDNSAVGVSATVNVTGAVGALERISFVGLNHTWVGDMTLTLIDPSTNSVIFLQRPNWIGSGFGNSSDFSANNIYGFTPSSPTLWGSSGVIATGDYLTSSNNGTGTEVPTNFSGVGGSGLWTVFATDSAGGDTGGFESVSLTFTPVPEPATMAALGMGALALLRRRKKA